MGVDEYIHEQEVADASQAEEQDERKEHARHPQDQLVGSEQRRDVPQGERETGHNAEGALRQQPARASQEATHYRIRDEAHQPTSLTRSRIGAPTTGPSPKMAPCASGTSPSNCPRATPAIGRVGCENHEPVLHSLATKPHMSWECLFLRFRARREMRNGQGREAMPLATAGRLIRGRHFQ